MLYSIFRIHNNLFGVPIISILEIVRYSRFHPVMGSPEIIDGLINLRGKVVPVINSGLVLDGEKVPPSDDSRIYIFKNNLELNDAVGDGFNSEISSDNIGLHVDSVCNVLHVDKKELQQVPENISHPFYSYVVRKNEEFIIILKPSQILNLDIKFIQKS